MPTISPFSVTKLQDILLRDETGTGGFSRFHREIVQHHISHKLRSSLRVGLISFFFFVFFYYVSYIFDISAFKLIEIFAGICLHSLPEKVQEFRDYIKRKTC